MTDARRQALQAYLAVGGGAAIGSLLRFLSSGLIVPGIGLSALWATGFVNVVGSFVIGLFAALTDPGGRFNAAPGSRLFVMGGICGGFTTFSAMSLDTFILLLEGDLPRAGLYLTMVIAISLAAVWLGHRLALRLNRQSSIPPLD